MPLAGTVIAALVALLALAAPAGSPSVDQVQAAPGPYTGDFPDPAILRVGDTYWAYATGTGGATVPVLRSTDLQNWYATGPDGGLADALPAPAAWGVNRGAPGRREVWAPSAVQMGGRFLLFYSVRVNTAPRRFCISVAAASSPAGPFADSSARPLVCDGDPAGSIDPSVYRDRRTGRSWLVWKSEGDVRGVPTRIWTRLLNRAGTGFARGSVAREVLRTSQRWEGPLIEGPSMVAYRGAVYLFYSANVWRSGRYATGVARCAGPAGPCTKAPRPLLASRGGRLGPGGAEAFIGPRGRLYLAYHYWNAPYTDYGSEGQRRLRVVPLSFDRTGWPRAD